MYSIDANSVLRRQVLRAALEQYATEQFRKMAEIIDSEHPDDNAAAAHHTRYQEAKDVLAELELTQRRRELHPASRCSQ